MPSLALLLLLFELVLLQLMCELLELLRQELLLELSGRLLPPLLSSAGPSQEGVASSAEPGSLGKPSCPTSTEVSTVLAFLVSWPRLAGRAAAAFPTRLKRKVLDGHLQVLCAQQREHIQTVDGAALGVYPVLQRCAMLVLHRLWKGSATAVLASLGYLRQGALWRYRRQGLGWQPGLMWGQQGRQRALKSA